MTTTTRTVGPTVDADGRVTLTVWAPDHDRVEARVDGLALPMRTDGDGYWVATIATATHGMRYGFHLSGIDAVLPDPASHWQPDGVDGLSALWMPGDYPWRDAAWRGVTLDGLVLYELHVGTFTQEGTWQAAARELPRLRDLGVTAVQVMPINTFPGQFGWGYDGVFWCAPVALYGTPDDLRTFVDEAHALGLGVILDAVFNHLGPHGNVLPKYSTGYVSDEPAGEWGDALAFGTPRAHGLRDLVLTAATRWIRDFHADGLRLDALQAIVDSSDDHIVAAIVRDARAAAVPRSIVVLAEHEPQHARIVRAPEAGGFGADAIDCEDLHHSWRVGLTGMREAYLSDYRGTTREWLAVAQHGFLYQGQHYAWQKAPRGAAALDVPVRHVVAFLENHDQVANISGARLVTQASPAWWRAATALLLLGPWTPLLFQGQEWGSRTPFHYFCDHAGSLQAAVEDGRRAFLSQFSRHARATAADTLDIGRPAFEASRLGRPPSLEDDPASRLHRDLLALRRQLRPWTRLVVGSTLSDRVLLLRVVGEGGPEALIAVNLDADGDLTAADPLVAPPDGHRWRDAWCSDDALYGGHGRITSLPSTLMATGHATTVYLAEPRA
jgi:maltooligosyltrehalose trehalohydrolase